MAVQMDGMRCSGGIVDDEAHAGGGAEVVDVPLGRGGVGVVA